MSFVVEMLEEMGWGDSAFVRRKKLRDTLKDHGCEHNKATELSSTIYDLLRDETRKSKTDEDLVSILMDKMEEVNGLEELTKLEATEEGVKKLLVALIVDFKY